MTMTLLDLLEAIRDGLAAELAGLSDTDPAASLNYAADLMERWTAEIEMALNPAEGKP